MTYTVTTLGCKVNEYESNFYTEELEKAGFTPALSDADVAIINTCTVTNTAAAKSRKMIRRMKKNHPRAKIVLAGCYASSASRELMEELEVDLLLPVSKKHEIVPMIQEVIAGGKARIEPEAQNVHDQQIPFAPMPVSSFDRQHRAFLKIQDGCNQFCAYCQIPYARGAERSWRSDEIIETARELARRGHLEIVLTGIHTGRFHDEKNDLAGLLRELLENTPEDVSYRISSIEISEITDELIKLMQENPRILHHLHIPIQSASNAVLERMNRPYTVEEYAARIEDIRKAIPDISISSDIIAGFVGESEEEFAETLQNLQDLKLSFLHVFGYSRREKTKADEMEGHLDPAIIRERTGKLLALSARLRKEDMKRFDRSMVLIEKQRDDGSYSGYTTSYHPVIVRSNRPLSGRIPVRLLGEERGVYQGVVDETV